MSESLTHLDAAGHARMVDVGGKPHTPRSATAEAVVRVSAELARAIREDAVKKGDALAVARLAGIQSAKKTSDLIPLCHPLPIDGVDVDAVLDGETVRITATVRTTYKTGVEMEAMTAASVAALTVVDMGKAIDRGIVIKQVRLLEKTGGRRGDYHADEPQAFDPPMRACVLTVSDRVSRGERDDASGPAVANWLRPRFSEGVDRAIVADEVESIQEIVRGWLADHPAFIVITGGTGLSPRDVTPEAVAELIDRPHPQLLDLAHRRMTAAFPKAALSRGVAGLAGRSLVLTVPGSPKGAVETLDALADVLPHALKVLVSDDDPHLPHGRGA